MSGLIRAAKDKDTAAPGGAGGAVTGGGADGSKRDSAGDRSMDVFYGLEKDVQEALLKGLGSVGQSAFSLLKQHLPPPRAKPASTNETTEAHADDAEDEGDVGGSKPSVPTFAAQFEESGGQVCPTQSRSLFVL